MSRKQQQIPSDFADWDLSQLPTSIEKFEYAEPNRLRKSGKRGSRLARFFRRDMERDDEETRIERAYMLVQRNPEILTYYEYDVVTDRWYLY